MRRNRVALRSLVGILFAVSLLMMATVPVAAAADSGTVSGTVMLDGKPLADVSVFLWVGYPELTCTDKNGEFTFENVPFDIDLLSATGTTSPEQCDNWRFLDSSGAELLSVFYDGHDGVAMFDLFRVTAAKPTYEIEYTPRRAKSGEAVCSGQLATQVGDSGDNELIGTDESDVIVGGAGNDIIRGKGGLDQICAGPGRDIVYGGADSDWIDGGPGRDRLEGGSGADLLVGGSGKDKLLGQAGNDVLWGSGGDDTLVGGPGSDIARGHGGDDVLKGKGGPDFLYGGADYDIAKGGGGDDACKAEEKYSC